MSALEVKSEAVSDLLEILRRGEWQIPEFQRDFVWSVSDVVSLVASIIQSRPIGMVTLWEQGDKPEVTLESVSIPDIPNRKVFSEGKADGSKVLAVLDGRQRCTAIAMAFGGLRAKDQRSRLAGRFFLDTASPEPSKRVRFMKEKEIALKGYNTDAGCIKDGLFPLSSSIKGEKVIEQLWRYSQALQDPTNYVNGELPSKDELNKRNKALTESVTGILKTKLAVYVVPETYNLSDICDIFETLNTTGTKVSTVDLMHSILYKDSQTDPEGPIRLRDWIDDFGEKEGAVGWASTEDRPELAAQIVTACYAALDTKAPARAVKGVVASSIDSIKSSDLLATPKAHWRSIISNGQLLADFLRDFQLAVAGGLFPYRECPYPVTAALYVALRWHLKFDQPSGWGQTDLDALFRAFFWRNALTSRYDQGFLTQLGSDIVGLKKLLGTRSKSLTSNSWVVGTQEQAGVRQGLNDMLKAFETRMPTREILVDWITSERQTGALQKALTLPMFAGVKRDIVDPDIQIEYPGKEPVELHHIYPKSWCENNKIGDLADALKERDWVDATCNLMPLSRKSNNLWKAKIPGQLFKEKSIEFSSIQNIARPVFLDMTAFNLLLTGGLGAKAFWTHRAELIADDILRRTEISF